MTHVTPKILVEKSTNKIVSWGYTFFTPTKDQYVVEKVILTQGQNIEDGLEYKNNKVIKNTAYETKKKTYKDEILEALGLTQTDIDKIKQLKEA